MQKTVATLCWLISDTAVCADCPKAVEEGEGSMLLMKAI